MSAFLANFVFLNPWALSALFALPALYLLLKITPPTPKIVVFPAARFLSDLKPKTNTANHTPWWLLLLRIMIIALLILAFARPVLNPGTKNIDDTPLLLIVDNGWSSAQNWDDIVEAATHEIRSSGQHSASIYILPTAENASSAPLVAGPFLQNEALSYIKALKPYPWPSNLRNASEALPDKEFRAVWLSDGIKKNGHGFFVQSVKSVSSGLNVTAPQHNALPFILKKSKDTLSKSFIEIDGVHSIDSSVALKILLLNEHGQVLDEKSISPSDMQLPAHINFELPAPLQAQLSSFKIANQQGAASVFIRDETGAMKTVGIVSAQTNSEHLKLREGSFYIHKALQPYANIIQGKIEHLIEQKPSVIILPDIAAIQPKTLNMLGDWVQDGGMLLRFAGPRMAQSTQEHALTPVPLRRAIRGVGGKMSFNDDPLQIITPEQNSPLYGLRFDEDIRISEQVLPEPSAQLSGKTWLYLDDGTPLITSDKRGEGLLVMIHTSASPEWSNLPLSGSYIWLLKRLLKFAGQSPDTLHNRTGQLQPILIMDGFGELGTPNSDVQPLNASDLASYTPGPHHPPGLYGQGGFQTAFNLGNHVNSIQALTEQDGVTLSPYGQNQEKYLAPVLLALAFSLFLIDMALLAFLARPHRSPLSGFIKSRAKKMALCFAVCVCILPAPSYAQTSMKASEDLYLAYIKTGNAAIDATSQKGLEVLSAALNNRTSAEPAGVIGINPETDIMSFFPLLYWPLSNDQPIPSTTAIKNIQSYLDLGGTVLIDTRDGSGRLGDLKRLVGQLNIPPLMEIPESHVLTKSFYLLKSYPGRYENGTLWVEGQSSNGRDGVSSVIIGSHDWAGAWSELNVISRGQRQYIQGSSKRHELSLRFGVNLIMYALTGNYKADQVHVPHILERLGRER